MLYTICYLLLIPMMNPGNDSIPHRRIILKTTVSLRDTSEFRGYLSSINDSSIVVVSDKVLAGFGEKSDRYKTFHYTGVHELNFKRKGDVGRGIAIGAASGLLVGTIIGVASYKKPPPNEVVWFDYGPGVDGAAGGLIGMMSGAAIGALIGTFATKRFMIKGRKEKMRDAHEYIEARLNRTRN